MDEGSDQDNKRTTPIKKLGKEKRYNLREIHKVCFMVNHKFKSKKELKEKIEVHALGIRRNLFFKKMTI